MTSGADVKSRNPGEVLQSHFDREDRKRNDLMRSFTTQELLDELVKRDGVNKYYVPKNASFSMMLHDGSFEPAEECGDGEATILVVRKGAGRDTTSDDNNVNHRGYE